MSDIRVIEHNGLYMVVSASNLQRVLHNYEDELLHNMQTMVVKDFALGLQKANKSITNIDLQITNALKMIGIICTEGTNIINIAPKTKTGKFNRTGKVWLYLIDITLEFNGVDVDMNIPAKLALTLGKNDTYKDWCAEIPEKAVSDEDYALLEKQFGKDFEKSGKFLFLRVDRYNTTSKNLTEFLYDKNGNFNQQSLNIAAKKKTAVDEYHVGSLYSNKNGKTYLCIPGFEFIDFTVMRHDYVATMQDGEKRRKQETRVIIALRDYVLYRKNLDKIVDRKEFFGAYEKSKEEYAKKSCKIKPIFIEYNDATRKRFDIDSCTCIEEVTLNYLKVAAKVKPNDIYDTDAFRKGLASKTKILGMLDETKKLLPAQGKSLTLECDFTKFKEIESINGDYFSLTLYCRTSLETTLYKKDL